MDLVPETSLLAILSHLSERDRLRVLSTCKRMRVWLQKRQAVAQAAFDAFKAQRLTAGNWHLVNELTVSTSETMRHRRGTNRWSNTVSLEDNSLISLISTEHFTMSYGRALPSQTVTYFFSPWFHAMTGSRGGNTRTKMPEAILQMLLSVSQRLQ